MLSLAQQVRLKDSVLVQQVGEESVLLSLDSEEYFGLDDIGTSMLMALKECPSIQLALDQLLTEYDVELDQLQADLIELVEKLVQHGLVEVTHP